MYSAPRACRPEELPALLRLVNGIFRSGGGDMGREYPLEFDPENVEQLRVIDRDGEIVAHVGVCARELVLLGVPLRAASIGAVGTHPACRGEGLASRLMADARAFALDRGADLMLISGGRGLYHRLGYVTVGRFPRWRAPESAPSTAVTVAPYEPADLPAIHALYEREPVRFRRSLRDWQRVLDAGMLMNRPSRLWVVRNGAEITAYLGVQEPSRGEGGTVGAARAMEIAGDRWSIAEAVGAILAGTGAPALDLIGPDGDLALRAHALARGWEASLSAFAGTLAVLSPAAFFDRLRPVFAERCGDDLPRAERAGEGLRLSLGEEALVLETLGQVTALLFGGDTDEARALPPLTGRLGEKLRDLLPLPLPWYGYNYV